MKSPAFQFYPNDWLSSTSVKLMTPAQRGGYMSLLAHDWNCDGIPDDDDELAVLSDLGEGWLKGGSQKVRKCFVPHPDRPGFITNPRLMQERAKQAEWRKKSSEGGRKSAKMRGLKVGKGGSRVVQPRPNQHANQNTTLQSSSSNTAKAVVQSNEEWLSALKANPAYTGIDIDREIAKAETWCANSTNRKFTRKFFINWLNRIDKPLQPVVVDKPLSAVDRRLHGINRDELMTWVRKTYPKTPDFFGPEQVTPQVVDEFRTTIKTPQA